MNKNIYILIVLIATLAAPTLAASQDSGRGVLFQLGAGASFPSYPSQVETVLSYMDSVPGIDRLKLSLDIALGAAISQQAYVMARVDGMADRLYDSHDFIQLNLYLYSLGLRYYPSVTGFYGEGGAGASREVLQSSVAGDTASDFAFGFGAAIGYDFNRNARGFGLCVEAKYDNLTIENEQVSGLMLTLNLCWK